jgi:predicted deacylase
VAIDLCNYTFKSSNFTSPNAGEKVIFTGAVHGNEICGTQAILRLMREMEAGEIRLVAGSVSFVPVCNPLAYALGQREGERNLNRRLRATTQITQFEDAVANWLCPLLAQHDTLVDMHSFRGTGRAFVMVGPDNNQGHIEAFALADKERSLALRLGMTRFVDGWLSTYAIGVQKRQARYATQPDLAAQLDLDPDLDPDYGVGTTETMRALGGCALTLECGQHQDPMASEVAYQAMLSTLRHFGMITGATLPEAPIAQREALRLVEVVDKTHTDDRFSRAWASFDQVKQGEEIGKRADGSVVVAEFDAAIVFPDAAAKAGEEWFYLARQNNRFM